MSFAEKIGSLMQRPNDDLVSKDEIPWWLKYSGRGLGTIGGGIAIFLGVFNIFFGVFDGISCIFGGIWQSVAGFTVIVIEAPCCCMFVDYVQEASSWVDKRPYWNRAAYYMAVAIVPIFICLKFTVFLGCGLIFATGVLYGMMALGKKASPEEMRNNATSIYATNNQQQFPPAATSNSNLVEGAHPVGFSNPFDSRV